MGASVSCGMCLGGRRSLGVQRSAAEAKGVSLRSEQEPASSVPSLSASSSSASSMRSRSSADCSAGPGHRTSQNSPAPPSEASRRTSRSALALPVYVLRGRNNNVEDKYHVSDQIGYGQYGVVRVAVEKATGLRYAIKSISKTRVQQDRHDYAQRIRTEVEILYHLGGHPNIVQLYDVFEDDNTIHLLMELCEGGDWFDQLLAGGAFTEVQAARAVRSVLKTLSYCHSLGVAHRDIKPENLLYTDRTPNAAIKLADFGLSAMVPAAGNTPDTTVTLPGSNLAFRKVVGSAMYMAPEVLTSHGVNKERDVWSLGVVLYITLSGLPPFDGNELQEVFDAVLHKPLQFDDPSWDQISVGAKDFISRMLHKDPKKRGTIQELLAHPWVACVSDNPSSAQIKHKASKPTAVPDTVVTRLHQFTTMNRFKKEARKVVSSFLPKEEVAGLRHLFQDMDINGDGVITLDELQATLASKRLNLTAEQAEEMLRCADLNNNGMIDYEEFLAATIHRMHLAKEELMRKTFNHFDHDGSGFITRQELKEALSYQGVEIDVDAIIRDIDRDGDDLISYEEFCSCLQERDEDQSGDNLWPLLSASLSIRHSLAANQSIRSRQSLGKSASGKPRQRVVHFQDSFRASLKSSLKSVQEDPATPFPHAPASSQPSLSNIMLTSPRSHASRASGRHPLESQLPPPAPFMAQQGSRRLGRSSSSGVTEPPAPTASASAVSVGGSSMVGEDAARDVPSRISGRRGSALMKSIMLDERRMEEIVASCGSMDASLHRSRSRIELLSSNGRPDRTGGAALQASQSLLVRDGSLRATPHRVAAANEACVTREGSSAVLVLPSLTLPNCAATSGDANASYAADTAVLGGAEDLVSGTADGGTKASLPIRSALAASGTPKVSPARSLAAASPATPVSPKRRIKLRQASRGRPTMSPRQASQSPCQYGTSPLSVCSGPHREASPPRRTRRAASRGRSPAHRSLSRSRPSRGSSRASSCGMSGSHSRASSRASSTSRSRCRSHCSSRGSSCHGGVQSGPRRNLSRSSSGAPSPQLPSWRSPQRAKQGGASRSLPGTVHQQAGLDPPPRARGQAQSVAGMLESPTQWQDNATWQPPLKLLNQLCGSGGRHGDGLGHHDSLLAVAPNLMSGSMERPSSAMLASLLLEWEGEMPPGRIEANASCLPSMAV